MSLGERLVDSQSDLQAYHWIDKLASIFMGVKDGENPPQWGNRAGVGLCDAVWGSRDHELAEGILTPCKGTVRSITVDTREV